MDSVYVIVKMPRSISYKKKKRTCTGNQYTKLASQGRPTNIITPRPNHNTQPSSSK